LRLSGFFEGKLFLIKTVRALERKHLRSILPFLVDITYETERVLKDEALETIKVLRPASLLSRLYSVYTHTEHDEKRISILNTFSELGAGVFAGRLIKTLPGENPPVAHALLNYLGRLPVLGDKEKKELESFLTSWCAEKSFDEIKSLQSVLFPLAFRHQLSGKKIFKNRFLPNGERSPDVDALFYFEWTASYSAHLKKGELATLWKNFLSVEPGQERWGIEAAYDAELRETFISRMPALFEQWENETSQASHHTVLEKMLWFAPEVTPHLVEALSLAKRTLFKELILEHLPGFALDEVLTEKLWKLLMVFIKDEDHPRMLESAARHLVLFFEKEGIKTFAFEYEKNNSLAAKASLLKGLLTALREDGRQKSLTALDIFHLHLVCEHTAARLAEAKVEDGEMLFRRFCQLIELLKLDNFQGELHALLKKFPMGRHALAALLRLGTDSSLALVWAYCKKAFESPTEEWERINGVFQELAKEPRSTIHVFDEEALKPFLLHPFYTASVLKFLSRQPLNYFRKDVAAFAESGPFLVQVMALEDLAQFPSASFQNELLAIFERSIEETVRLRAGHLLLRMGDEEIGRKVIGDYIEKKRNPAALMRLVEKLEEEDLEVLAHASRVFFSFRYHEHFKKFNRLAQKLAIIAPPLEGEILPLDEVLRPKKVTPLRQNDDSW
jgi:hypothetical protein